MSSRNTKYGIAIMLPDPPASDFRRIQKECRLPPWQPTFDLHITLVPPFNSGKTLADIIKTFNLQTLRTPFPIRIAGIDRFDNAESVVYARVWRSDPLSRLQGELASAALALRKPLQREFTPHATLANPASKQAVDGYMRCLEGKIGNYDFTCASYVLLQLDERARAWKTVHEYPLAL